MLRGELLRSLSRPIKLKILELRLPKEFKAHLKNLNKQSIAIDVGANVGAVSEILCKSGARVFAFEPNVSAFNSLQKRQDRLNNLFVKNVAAGVQNRKTHLYLHKETGTSNVDLSQASSLLSQKPNVSDSKYTEIEEIDFIPFLESFDQKIDLIKIDIEGYEIKLLDHMLDRFNFKMVDRIYVETHEKKWPELSNDTEKLKLRIENLGLSEKINLNWH